MKVLIASDFFTPTINGVVTSITNLQQELERHGHEVKILTLRQKEPYGYEECVYVLPSFSAGRVYPGARVVRSLGKHEIDEIRAWKPDIIHTQNEFSTFFLSQVIASKLNIPIVHTFHTVYEDYVHYFSPSVTMGRTMVRKYFGTLLEKVDAVVVPTEKVRDILESYGVDTPIHTVPTGINLDRFRKVEHDRARQALRAQYGIAPEEFLMLSLGRLAKEKNVEEIITFLGRLPDGIRLVIVGGGPYQEILKAYAEETGLSHKVIFTGMVPPQEVPSYYHMADVFVSASTSETQGLTYVEALAAGLPALCRRDGALDEVIIDGINGWQYDSEEAFLESAHRLAADRELQDRMGEAALATAERYSTEAFYEGILKVYETTLEQTGKQYEPLPGWLKKQLHHYNLTYRAGKDKLIKTIRR